MTKRGSWVSSVVVPEASTRNRLSHCMVSTGFLRANCRPIWMTPSAMPNATDRTRSFVSRKRTRKNSVEARSDSSAFAEPRRSFTGDSVHGDRHPGHLPGGPEHHHRFHVTDIGRRGEPRGQELLIFI